MKSQDIDVQGPLEQSFPDVQPSRCIGPAVTREIFLEASVERGVCLLLELFLDALTAGPFPDVGMDLHTVRDDIRKGDEGSLRR